MEAKIKVALIETKPSKNDFYTYFNKQIEMDRYALCSDPTVEKVLKRHIDIEIDTDAYDWIILVGSEATKMYAGKSVTDYTGRVLDDKFIPVINPAMIKFKPAVVKTWEESRDRIIQFITGEKKVIKYNTDKVVGINDTATLINFLKAAIASPNEFFAIDSETSDLYPRNGHILGVSLSYERDHGAYINSDCIDEVAEELFQELFRKKKAILHNAKFDLGWFKYHLGWDIVNYEDTMLLHYCINEVPGTHSLKKLAIDYTEYGGYEDELDDYKANYCKVHGVLKDNFTYDLIPFDVMYKYAAIDAIVTFLIYCKLKPTVTKNPKLDNVYRTILLPASTLLTRVENNGVPFDRERLVFSQGVMQKGIEEAIEKLYKDPRIKDFEEYQGKEFNPNSVTQLRNLLFDYLKIPPTGKLTDTGAASTSAEVLQELAEDHEVPGLILDIRKKTKIKNTYLDKIIPQLDRDKRLRTGFNIHGTTSGRLSSSGKLNLQQLPRDEPAVKGSIKARPGYKIVSVDLTTAEMYIAAVISGDKALRKVFSDKQDFHSSIAKRTFNLPCAVEEVKTLYPLFRQASKAISFGILYGATKWKISDQVTKDAKTLGMDYIFTVEDAEDAINKYFIAFPELKRWIDKTKKDIANAGFTYSFFGRKRRLPDVFAENKGTSAHEVRSGLNFLVQSPASDVNLLAAIEMDDYIVKNNMDATIFALVHDSILAEVREDLVTEYSEVIGKFITKDRGLSIPGCPIGFDIEVGDDYSFGKFNKKYPEFSSNTNSVTETDS